MRIFREIGIDADATGAQPAEEISLLRTNLAGVKSVIAIASSKGGVGKSTLTVNLAAVLALAGRKVAILDADLNSPSIVAMLGMKVPRRFHSQGGIEPGAGPLGLRVAASNLLPDGEAAPVSFLDDEAAPAESTNGHRPVELGYAATLRRLLTQTRFGTIDLLLIDLGPGIEQLFRIAQVAPLSGVLIVTQPSQISVNASRAALEMSSLCSTPVIGVVENMVGFNCDGCHAVRPLMPHGDLTALANAMGVPVLARLPFDPRLAECCDRGVIFVREYADSPLARQLTALAQSIDLAAIPRIQAEMPAV
ncbi:MAG TPA: P-loop NTPase [Candidatus Binataceae bacterium]|jgi:ATP-binding protein involved in chromosome partitioning|nr:P-loop NTPase [Candidatus Binataceae bacterium]